MREPTQNPMSAVHHLNNGLFADYYLDEIVPTLPDWDTDIFYKSKQVFEQLKALLSRTNPAALDEAQLEEQWVKPVLAALDHRYSVQVKIRFREQGHRRPDYVFVASDAEARALTNEIYGPQAIAHTLAVGDAKRWGVNLDQSAPGQRNPSQQIDEYLRYSELPWGILTDGRYWRLYQRDSSKYNNYYAVDLEHLLLNGDADSFRYFYAFFRQQAFTEGWLIKVLSGSTDFAQKLTDKLEDEVYEALELIAQGFLDYRRNQLIVNPETLRTIYEQSLVLLYRLLFLFYAESREVLPLHQNREYTDHRSLQSIKRTAAQALDFNTALNPDSSEYYNRLLDLFFAVDAGDPRLDMPPYNGRLFSESEHNFLAEKRVGDAHLALALDKLARIEVQNGRQAKRVFVDYRDLDVRHLGSIYEKLLEYELDIANEPLTLKGDQYSAASGGEIIIKQLGQVYLRTGSNERKITGSYYTPDYIVRFIVEKTLEPLLTEITHQCADLDAEGLWHVHDREGLISAILGVNVLDPATGSGHFAVDVTAYVAEWLRSLALRPADIGAEDELLYWKRQVASACIYAVDINPLAVELAKLSMWLTTLAKGKPLSFLDHHIRVGNTLVGASIAEISGDPDELKRRKRRERLQAQVAAAGQTSMFSEADFTEGVRFAVAEMAKIESTIADEVSDVKRQEQMYAELTQRMSVWKQAADVWTARSFGLAITTDQWQAVRKLTTQGYSVPEIDRLVEQAETIANRKDLRFFHWEIVFPEIFFDENGQPKTNPGFDAVVGNPPYVRQERIQPIKPLLQRHYEVYSGTADLFLYFYERCLEFLRPERRLGFITSGTYMNSNSAKPFREYIHENASLEWVANFGENQPFRGAEMVYPTIVVMQHSNPRQTFRNLFVDGIVHYSKLGESLENGDWTDSLSEVTAMDEWRFQPKALTELFKKIIKGRLTLSDVVNGRIYRGITTGLNEAFVIDDEVRRAIVFDSPNSAEIIKPLSEGKDFRPWYQIDSGLYLLWAYQGIDIDAYPAVKDHLSKWERELAKRWEAEKGQIKWYELRPCEYYAEFEQPKIYWAEISKLPRFSRDDSGLFSTNKGHMVITDKFSLLGLLNSRVLWFIISQTCVPLRLRAGLWQYQTTQQFVRRLPVPEFHAEQESELSAIADEITVLARQRYAFHEQMRYRIRTDLGSGAHLNDALTEWWTLADGVKLREEVKKAFKTDIPLRERGDWEKFLAEQHVEHRKLTDQIITLETRMNAIVYDAFQLTPEERDLIERTTKYPYGEV